MSSWSENFTLCILLLIDNFFLILLLLKCLPSYSMDHCPYTIQLAESVNALSPIFTVEFVTLKRECDMRPWGQGHVVEFDGSSK